MLQNKRVGLVINIIVDGIRSGQFLMGERLSESKLSKLSGEGAGQVRDALQMLAGNGVVTIAENRGAAVTSINAEQAGQALYVLISFVELGLRGNKRESWQSFLLSLDTTLDTMKNHQKNGNMDRFSRAFIRFFRNYASSVPSEYINVLLSSLTPDILVAWMFEKDFSADVGDKIIKCFEQVRLVAIKRDIAKIQESFFECLPCLGLASGPSEWCRIPPSHNNYSMFDKATATGKVIDHIITGLHENSYFPGQGLVESDLIEATGVGRTPIRQALRLLAGQNLLEIIPNKGARIKKLRRQDAREILLLLWHLSSIGIKGALRRNPLGDVSAVVKDALKNAENVAKAHNVYQFMTTLIDYHMRLNELSRNDYLQRGFSTLYLDFFNRELAVLMTIEGWTQYIRRYRSLTDQICQGSEEGALREFWIHTNDLLKLFEADSDKVVF